jgi:hypothetical protein
LIKKEEESGERMMDVDGRIESHFVEKSISVVLLLI